MNLRISYLCIAFAIFSTVRFWLLAQEADESLSASVSLRSQFDPSLAQKSDLIERIDHLEAERKELIAYAGEMAKLNARITRIVISFLLLATVCYILEERKKRKEPSKKLPPGPVEARE